MAVQGLQQAFLATKTRQNGADPWALCKRKILRERHRPAALSVAQHGDQGDKGFQAGALASHSLEDRRHDGRLLLGGGGSLALSR